MSQHNSLIPSGTSSFEPGHPGISHYRSFAGRQNDNRLSLGSYLRIASTYRDLILSISVAVVVLTILAVFLWPQKFTAEALVRIGTYTPVVHGFADEDLITRKTQENDYLNTQIELLSSLSLADMVMRDSELRQDFRAYLDYDFDPLTRDETGRLVRNPEMEEQIQEHSVTIDKNYQNVVDELEDYLELVRVYPLKKTSLVKITAKTADPELSARIANAHGESFIQLLNEQRRSATITNLVFLKTQAAELSQKVILAQRKMAQYAEENAIVSLTQNENIVVKRMAELDELLTQATSKRIRSESALKEAQSGSGLALSTAGERTTQDIRIALRQAEAEYAMLLKKYRAKYPKVRQLKARIEAYKESLESRRLELVKTLEAEYQADRAAETALQEELDIQKSKAFDLAKKQVDYNILKREYESLKDLHQTVIRQLKEAQVRSEMKGQDVVLVEQAAVPRQPSSPKRFLSILLALFFGPLVGFALAILLDNFDNTVKTPTDIKDTLQLPMLGMIPDFNGPHVLASAYHPYGGTAKSLPEPTRNGGKRA